MIRILRTKNSYPIPLSPQGRSGAVGATVREFITAKILIPSNPMLHSTFLCSIIDSYFIPISVLRTLYYLFTIWISRAGWTSQSGEELLFTF